MKKVILSALTAVIILSGCGSSNDGELTGVPGRKNSMSRSRLRWHSFLRQFLMGPSDQDAVFALNSISKSVMLTPSGWIRPKLQTINTVSLYIKYVIRS
jgi:hypothetical protein